MPSDTGYIYLQIDGSAQLAFYNITSSGTVNFIKLYLITASTEPNVQLKRSDQITFVKQSTSDKESWTRAQGSPFARICLKPAPTFQYSRMQNFTMIINNRKTKVNKAIAISCSQGSFKGFYKCSCHGGCLLTTKKERQASAFFSHTTFPEFI